MSGLALFLQDIKLQKISPEGKPKVQLQVVLHDGNSSTFHFVNRTGQAAQIADRDKVKELLQQLLPNFKRKVDKELEEKNRILSENPNLLQMYKDLVITQVLTSEEFWSTHAKQYNLVGSGASGCASTKQDIGVSGAFLADIKPQTDGCNGFRYNLTADIIACIFKTYPAVKRKHAENVPTKLTESEFWTKFFQSHYFHRDRITAGTKDIFTECGKIDDLTLRADVARGAGDPLLDLRLFEDNTLQEGFGGAVPEAKDKVHASSGNIVHLNMIKRFNQHSIMVLKTCTEVLGSNSNVSDSNNSSNSSGVKDKTLSTDNSSSLNHTTTNGMTTNGGAAELNNNVNGLQLKHSKGLLTNGGSDSPTIMEPEAKRARIMTKIIYDDLAGKDDDGDDSMQSGGQLSLTKVERYLHGPPSSTTSIASPLDGAGSAASQHYDLASVQATIGGLTDAWAMRTPHKALVSPTAAVNALGELSPGGALMRGFQEQSLARKLIEMRSVFRIRTAMINFPFSLSFTELVPPEVEKELRGLYMSLCELLRHFWQSFPPTTAELESKVVRMHEALQRFRMAKLTPFEDRAIREFSPLGASLTLHLNQLLQAAAGKYTKFQETVKKRQMR